MHRYLVIIEPTTTGFSAYSPDLPGCVATGASRADIERTMREAVAVHLEGLRDAGLPSGNVVFNPLRGKDEHCW